MTMRAGDVIWAAAAVWGEDLSMATSTSKSYVLARGMLANASTQYLSKKNPYGDSVFQHKRKPYRWWFHPFDENTGELKKFPDDATLDDLNAELVGTSIGLIFAYTEQECQELFEEKINKMIRNQQRIIEQAQERIELLQRHLEEISD